MNIVLKYFFQRQKLRNNLLRSLLFFVASLLIAPLAYAQQYTLRDQAEIKYQAQLTLIEYESILNLISNSAISESVLKDAAQNSYDNPNTRIFYSSEVPVVDDIEPSSPNSTDKSSKTVKDYIREFSAMYIKSDLETVDFYDFTISNLKSDKDLYVRVKYTVHFKGRHKTDPARYKPADRLAELKVARKGNRWVTYIAGITAYDPAFPIASAKGDVALNRNVADDGTFAEKLNSLTRTQNNEAQKVSDLTIALSWQALDNKRFEEVRLAGQQAEARRDYAKASHLYNQALQIKPKEAAVEARLFRLNKIIQHNELLAKMFDAGEYVEAIKVYSKAINSDPENADLYYGRGRSYEKLNELETAIKDFSTAIKLDENFIDALRHRAQLYLRTSQPQKAIEDYNYLISSQQDAAAYYPERAKIKIAVGDIKGALEDYSAAIRLNPNVAVYHFEQGQLYYQQKQLEQAIKSFSAAIDSDKQLVNAYYSRGMVYADNQNINSAAADFERARSVGLEKEQLLAIDNIALEYISSGQGAMEKADYKNALENFIKVVLLSPADESAWLMKGDAHYKLQDYENAVQSYTKAIELGKVSQAYYKRGLVYRQLKNYEAAKSDFNKFIPIGRELISITERKANNAKSAGSLEQIAAEVAQAWYTLGHAQEMAEQYKDALVSLEKALDINKGYAQALFARGSVQLALKDYKKAIKDIEKSIKWGIEDSPWIYLALGKAYEGIGQFDYAISIYTYIIDSVDKNSDLAYIQRAAAYKNIKQYQLALQDIKAAMSLNSAASRDVDLLTSKGLIELYASKFQEADDSFDQALSIEKNKAWALYGKASVLASQNKMEESLDYYRKAFQTGEIQWSAIKDDPIIKHVSKQKAFKDLVDASLRL